MGFHHVAVVTRDLAATHAFYTDAMGFDLGTVEAAATDGGGCARHVFYDTCATTRDAPAPLFHQAEKSTAATTA